MKIAIINKKTWHMHLFILKTISTGIKMYQITYEYKNMIER